MTSATPLLELNRLLSSNAQWAADVSKHEPSFFAECAKGQAPKVLWIGCADSRVPESVIMACKPGDIFVHRNIANQFHLDDDSAQSVLAYAVQELGVEHVVVVGHTQCGGVAGAYKAACNPTNPTLSKAGTTPLSRWLTPLIELASSPSFAPPSSGGGATANGHVNGNGTDRRATLAALGEANVRAQVAKIVKSDVILTSWEKAARGEAKSVYVHGWVYELESGRLRDLGVSSGPEGSVGARFVGGRVEYGN